jgi:hypothetical protein
VNGVVLVTEAQRTGQMMTMLIVLLVVVAVLLAVATIWYWRRTDPRRLAQTLPQYRRVEAVDSYGTYGDRPVSSAGNGYGSREPAPTGQLPAAGSGHPGSDQWPPRNGRTGGGPAGQPGQHNGGWR